MSSPDQIVDESAAALRELMAAPSDGQATRARLLADVAGRLHRRRRWRRLALMLSIPLAIVGSASAAFTLGGGWRRAPDKTMTSNQGAGIPGRTSSPATAIGPANAVLASPIEQNRQDEAAYYGRAHRTHFVEDSPSRALGAWDQYLRRYPRGTFVPEARFNRALCLMRLGENLRAAEALQPFALGRFKGYRRQEACALLERLTGKPPSECLTESP